MALGIDIRKSAVMGTFYPEDKNELNAELKFFFDNIKEIKEDRKLRALILPHAGYIYSGQTAAWGFRQLQKHGNPHFVLIGPAHYYQFDGIVASQSKFWETPLGQVRHLGPINIGNVIRLDERAHNPEHSIEVQVPFLQYLYKDKFTISCFLTGIELDIEKSSRYFTDNYSDCVFLVSSDLSHYLSDEEAKERDRKTIESILNLNSEYLEKEENVACGANGISVLFSMAKNLGWQGKLIKYDTSATATRETNKVVGYASIGFYK